MRDRANHPPCIRKSSTQDSLRLPHVAPAVVARMDVSWTSTGPLRRCRSSYRCSMVTSEAPSPDVMDRWLASSGEVGPVVIDMGAPFGAAVTVASDGTASEGGRPGPGDRLHVSEAPRPSRCRRDGPGMLGVEQRRLGQPVRGYADGLRTGPATPTCVRTCPSGERPAR